MKQTFFLTLIILAFLLTRCGGSGNQSSSPTDSAATKSDSSRTVSIKEENVDITVDTTTMKSFAAYNENGGKQPIVLIVPEWWGLTDFTKSKARQLAENGYFALVVDMYGNGSTADNPDAAMKYAGSFYKNPQLATSRLEAALAKAKTYAQADSSKTAAIGFCFGGSMVLNAAKMGMPLDGVVSFHGGLQGVAPAKNGIKAKILVLNGAADPFVPAKDIQNFKKQMDSAGVPYTFKDYPGALHAFTNPAADEVSKKFKLPVGYNEAADKNSWIDMKVFFAELWK
ncbi:MAG TPA: dienelactone hydrolase family protein [Flavitalea sp.]|nr:dienelactone hydrolase family protein [Flavitalea sp.]